MKKAAEDWGTLAQAVVEKRMASIPVSIPAENGEYAFQFPLSDDAKSALVQAGIDYALASGLKMTQENIPKIQEHMQRVAYYMQGPEITEAAIRDAITKGIRMGLKQHVRPSTPNGVDPGRPTETQWIEEVRRNPFG